MPQVDIDKRILLTSIKTLTFFSDAFTQGRRTRPIPQLTCNGKACKLYQPDAVYCTNIGGQGNNVQWKCEADLPSTLRFSKLDVNCEGWSRSGDPFVLEGSCALSYDLIKLPSSLHDGSGVSGIDYKTILLIATIILLLLYLFRRATGSPTSGAPFFSNWGSGTSSNDSPPPPYIANAPPPKPSSYAEPGWRPGFWSGLGLGSIGSYLWANQNARSRYDTPRSAAYDWERPYGAGRTNGFNQGSSSSFQTRFPSSSEGMWSGSRARNADRGEGSSRLGSMRTASGLARTSTR